MYSVFYITNECQPLNKTQQFPIPKNKQAKAPEIKAK
jgi:hypothetical protein